LDPSARQFKSRRPRRVFGKSNKENSDGTVKSHVKDIFAKMNVIQRSAAVANATGRGLIQLFFPSFS
jgi:hypothetical protein